MTSNNSFVPRQGVPSTHPRIGTLPVAEMAWLVDCPNPRLIVVVGNTGLVEMLCRTTSDDAVWMMRRVTEHLERYGARNRVALHL